MRVLLIDDKIITVQGVIDTCKENNIECDYFNDFEDGEKEYRLSDYDVLVLDLKQEPTMEYPGREMLKRFWETKFIPTIVFSDNFHEEDKEYKNKFLYWNKKHEEEAVCKKLLELSLYADKLSNIRIKVNELYKLGLMGFDENFSDASNIYSVNNYIGYYINELLEAENTAEKLHAKIQLISLPEFKQFYSCDIIQSIPRQGKEFEFYMIVSAGCDLAHGTKKILCKKILPFESKNKRKVYEKKKNDGGSKSIILLPDNDYFKDSHIECKENILIEVSKISKKSNEMDNEYEYRKIFSISSPFRERIISMAHNFDSRIGVPDLDEKSWWTDEN